MWIQVGPPPSLLPPLSHLDRVLDKVEGAGPDVAHALPEAHSVDVVSQVHAAQDLAGLNVLVHAVNLLLQVEVIQLLVLDVNQLLGSTSEQYISSTWMQLQITLRE